MKTTSNLPGAPVALVERSWPGLSFGRYRENIRAGVEWPIRDARHTFVVHIDGRMDRMESELEGSGSIRGGALPGEVWSVPAQHRYATSAQGKVITYSVLKVDEAALRASLGSRSHAVELMGCLGKRDPVMLQMVQGMSALATTSGDIARLGLENMARGLGAHILTQYRADTGRALQAVRRRNELPEKAAARLSDYITDSLGGRITLAELSAVAGMSEHQLLEGFALHFGDTPAQYILRLRMRRVRHLLATTTRTITDIALSTGFSSASHLSTAFKARVGCTPSAYRAGC